MHYVSKALQDAEVQYPNIEKLAFALVVSARCLRPYFQARTIHALTNQLLRQVLQKPETSSRLVKWAIELSEFDIHYKPRRLPRDRLLPTLSPNLQNPKLWLLLRSYPNLLLPRPWFTSPATATLTPTSPYGHYMSMILLMRWVLWWALSLSPQIKSYLSMPSALNSTPLTMSPNCHSENSRADALARLALAVEQGIGCNIHMEFLDQPSTQIPTIYTIDHSPTWMDPILQFLQHQILPADPVEARRVRYRSARYLIINGALYNRCFSLPYLRCLTLEEGNYVLQEIQERICGNHSGARSLAHKAIWQGYFWPSLHNDA
ncbi:hypothetical protein L3X38_032717 [Prunus dulcis]|uniref:Reverse transcriptase RNase H-like domain-containing protein n=1 Tax=Prunus dulcis TaxID=3755 RepID=A0AAD4VEN1_PRUDU|nr:hypothetical protein L3X38_032717 [Prunus dulcis]